MAHLIVPRVQDNSGNAFPGALLYVYQNSAFTTPAELFSTATLAQVGGSGDMANPVVAASDGRFPTVFIEEDSVVYWRMTDANGDLLQEVEAVKGVPGSPLGINLDFGDDGRFKVEGQGGIVQMEMGDPTGDESGGDMRLGGWAGTQATSLEIDVAEVTVSGDQTTQGDHVVDGDFTFAGGQTADLVISEGTLAAAATQAIEFPAGYDIYELDLVFTTLGAGTISAVVSYDNGATYKSTNEYVWRNHRVPTSGTPAGSATNATTSIQVTDQGSAQAGAAHYVRMNILNLADKMTAMWWSGLTISTLSEAVQVSGAANLNAVFGRATHIRFSSGASIAFRYILKGRRRAA